MPKVISVLELLENLIIKNEKENDELNDLKSRINSLENEKKQRLDEKEKFDKVSLGFSDFFFSLTIYIPSHIGIRRNRRQMETRDT